MNWDSFVCVVSTLHFFHRAKLCLSKTFQAITLSTIFTSEEFKHVDKCMHPVTFNIENFHW